MGSSVEVTGTVYAVDGITFSLARGETLSLVGESGCGKSTVGRAVLRLQKLTSGEVYLDGARIDNMPARRLRAIRQRVQVVFQDPFSSLNPRMKVRDILAEPLRNFGAVRGGKDVSEKVGALLEQVGLPAGCYKPLPSRIFWWPAAADRHRQSACPWRRLNRLRRSGVSTGCLGRSSDHQSLGGLAG